jgi:hypothetical protein
VLTAQQTLYTSEKTLIAAVLATGQQPGRSLSRAGGDRGH